MFPPDQYELLDFGHGRRLERFGQLVLDRPYPAVEQEAIADAHAWANADARFVRPTDGEAYWMPGATGGSPVTADEHWHDASGTPHARISNAYKHASYRT